MTFGHLTAGIRIFGPAIAGALMQLMAVLVITFIFYLLARAQYFPSGWPLSICGELGSCDSAAPLLRLSYLLTAIGVAMTNNRFMALTRLWVREISRAAPLGEPKFFAPAIAVQLSIAAIGSLIEELDTPAQVAVSLGQWIGGIWLGAILWPAMWSIMIAAIGSLIHVLYLSTRPVSVHRS